MYIKPLFPSNQLETIPFRKEEIIPVPLFHIMC